MTKLSIITINRNNAQGLKRTIESVVSQTCTDFEYIIVDGASTDESVSIIQQFNNSTIQRFNSISEPDSGIFHAMNKGIKIASGDYLLFLNSGDFLYTETVLEEAFANKIYTEDFICARCAISNNGNIEFITSPPNEFTFKNFFETTLAHQSTFIKRALFETYGYYREDLKLKGDWEFFVRTIILNRCTTVSIDVLLTDFNVEGVSSSSSNRAKQKMEMELIYNETILCKFVPDYFVFNERLNQLKPYFWIKNKRLLNYFLVQLYNIARSFSEKSKRMFL